MGKRKKILAKGRQPLLLNNKSTILVGLMVLVVIFSILQYYLYFETTSSSNHINIVDNEFNVLDDLDLALKPFHGDRFPLNQVFGDQAKWGTLNSGHYFGLKRSTPDSIETSLIWFENQLNQNGGLDMRHLCDQNDKLNSYSWLSHNFHSFGIQEIKDNDYKLTTSFMIDPDHDSDWMARIDVEPSEDHDYESGGPLSLIHYVTTNHKDDDLNIVFQATKKLDISEDGKIFELKGQSNELGEFVMSIFFIDPTNSGRLVHGSHLIGKMNKERFSITSYIQSRMTHKIVDGVSLFTLPGRDTHDRFEDKRLKNPNLVAFQSVLYGPASFLIKFRRVTYEDEYNHLNFDLGSYQSAVTNEIKKFETEFERKFPISKLDLHQNFTRGSIEKLAKVSLSNMIGSVGYFHGASFIAKESNLNRVAPYGPIQLLTGVPSRSFFPRGFLWDEGFHNLLISRWDPSLSNIIIRSWFNIMNVNGWIPREVILGLESMRRVPPEFIVQKISNANPPAMFVVIEEMLDKQTLDQATFDIIYPRLKAWYSWFNITQSGSKPGTYRWRGRDELSVSMLNPKTLASGLDDYPRASHPSPSEYHIDLLCWMAMAARTLKKFAEIKGDRIFLDQITKESQNLNDNELLNELHWSKEHKMYCDYGENTEKAELVLVTKRRPSKYHPDRFETYQVMERHSVGHPVFGCVSEFGYVSLFPLLMKILDHRSEKLGIILDRLRDEKELWSPYGIRSLSKLSRYYNKSNTQDDKPYWRGPIWLNINYLILSSLKFYSNIDGPYKEKCASLSSELKTNLITNVLRQFETTNYLWESYDDETGQGKGSHPFTGWSSLILLIMSDQTN